MAVIKQRTQVFNKPIGVVRAGTGAAQVAEAVSQLSSNISNSLFEVAAEQAEDRGTKKALAQSDQDIVTIDPETGMPVAYKSPAGYGSIAKAAYQDLIDRRFMESVQNEIQRKASEVSSSASSAKDYQDRMSSYLAEMHKSAVSEDGSLNAYGRQMADYGSEYIASTYQTLRKKEIDAQRAAVKRQNDLNAHLALKKAEQLVISGGDPEKIKAILEQEEARNSSMLAAGGSVKSYASRDNELTKLRSMMSNQSLVSIYAGLSEGDRLQVQRAVRDPSMAKQAGDAIGVSNLPTLIAQAKIEESASSILSGLSSIGQIETNIDERATEVAVQKLDITGSSTFNSVEQGLSKIQDEDVRNAARADAMEMLSVSLLEEAGLDDNQIDIATAELKLQNPDLNKVAKLLGPTVGAENLLKALSELSAEDRGEVAKVLADRRPELSRIETDANAAKAQSFRADIRSLPTSTDLIGDYEKQRKKIANSGLSNTDTLLTVLDENFTAIAIERQSQFNVSASAYDAIQDEVINNRGVFKPSTDDERGLLELLKKAHSTGRTTTVGAMGSTSDAKKSQLKDSDDALHLKAITQAAQEGQKLNKADIGKLDEAIFKDGPVFLSEINDKYPQAVAMFSSGVVLPSVSNALSNALESNNSAEIEAAIILFEQGVNSTGTTKTGEVVSVDSMRSALPKGDYAEYQALLFASRQYGESPVTMIAKMREYDGDIEADILKELGKPENARLSDVFTDIPMSAEYRSEVSSALMVIKARGGRVTEDTVNRLIQNYSKNAKKDEAVVGPYIGDDTVYARTNYFKQSEIIQNEMELTDAMIEAGVFDDLLTGGTTLDAIFANLGVALPTSMLARSKNITDAIFGNLENLSENARKERLRAGLESIGLPLKYRANVPSFDRGNPSYDVGYDDGFGFTPITVNGEVWTLERGYDSAQDARSMRLQMYRDHIFAQEGDATRLQKARAETKYLATLENVTEESFKENEAYERLKSVLGEDPMILFGEIKSQIEGLQ